MIITNTNLRYRRCLILSQMVIITFIVMILCSIAMNDSRSLDYTNVTDYIDINYNKYNISHNDNGNSHNTINYDSEKYIGDVLIPGFIIVGAQKCGTTSLFKYLMQHPQIAEIKGNDNSSHSDLETKELRYFNGNVTQDTFTTYLKHFVTKQDVSNLVANNTKIRPVLTGEASPGYMFSPEVASKIKHWLPHVKIIMLLRSPADRALSHFHHWKSISKKNVTDALFSNITAWEMKVINNCTTSNYDNIFNTSDVSHMTNNTDINAYQRFLLCHKKHTSRTNLRYNSWVSQLITRGLYVPQVLPYVKHFPKQQLLVLRSEDLYDDTVSVMNLVTKFLGVQTIDWSPIVDKKYNFGVKNKVYISGAQEHVSSHSTIDPTIHDTINNFAKPFNTHLHDLVGVTW